jgi:hypothetical protein
MTVRLFKLDGDKMDAVAIEGFVTGLRALCVRVLFVVECSPSNGNGSTWIAQGSSPLTATHRSNAEVTAQSLRAAGFIANVTLYRRA